MQEFLIVNKDAPFDSADTYVVWATSEQEAVTKYVKKVIAVSALHRESVRSLSINVSFAERFYLSSAHEIERFTTAGEYGTEPELVRSRVRAFFGDRPDLGEAYLKYMDTEDEALLSDELFEFTALKVDPREEHGICAIPLRALPVLE